MREQQSLVDRARRYLVARRGERVTLAELAGAVESSPFHLQRSFKRALGLSPLDYQREQRLEDAKRHMANGRRVTDALFDAGYGSLSRFYERASHRLGMSARAYRARGKGERVEYAVFASGLGRILVARTVRGVCAVRLGADTDGLVRELAEEFSAAELVRDERALASTVAGIRRFLAGDGTLANVPLDLRGTVFQRRVWDALRRIPLGETRSYGEIARAIGRPGAGRAVGLACGANPAALVVPCHRALRADGGLGGYAWGLKRKRRLLRMEKNAAEDA